MNDEFILYVIIVVTLLYIIYMLNIYTCMKFENFEDVATPSPPPLPVSLPPNTIKIININELVDKTFKLFISIPKMPTYVKGETFTETPANTFYLAVETLDPNCQVKLGDVCNNIYVPNKNCADQLISLATTPKQLVLASSKYCDDPSIPIGKNNEFVIRKMGDKYYLQNVNTKLFVSFYQNTMTQSSANTIYGNMINDEKSNISQMINYGKNTICVNGQPPTDAPIAKNKEIFVTCKPIVDETTYLNLVPNSNTASPIGIMIQPDGKITIYLIRYNHYGMEDKQMPLIICNFDVNTQKDIERVTNVAGAFFINMVCLPKNGTQVTNDDSNALKFNVVESIAKK